MVPWQSYLQSQRGNRRQIESLVFWVYFFPSLRDVCAWDSVPEATTPLWSDSTFRPLLSWFSISLTFINSSRSYSFLGLAEKIASNLAFSPRIFTSLWWFSSGVREGHWVHEQGRCSRLHYPPLVHTRIRTGKTFRRVITNVTTKAVSAVSRCRQPFEEHELLLHYHASTPFDIFPGTITNN